MMRDPQLGDDRTPVSVITGFLGSGKTTLLNRLLRDSRMANTAVLVNEFGEIGIDHLLVESLDENVVLLGAGCLCCTIRDDLVASLDSLLERRDRGEVPAFSRVIIETTGLADPAPILHTLLGHERLRSRVRVDGIITTVDVVHAARQLDEFEESVKQVAVADRVILTKSDLAPAEDRRPLHKRLLAINPGAPLIESVDGDIDPGALVNVGIFDPAARIPDVERWLAAAANPDHAHYVHGYASESEDDGIRTFSLVAQEPLPIHRFVAWVESVLVRHGDRLLRLKGILNVLGSESTDRRARGPARVPPVAISAVLARNRSPLPRCDYCARTGTRCRRARISIDRGFVSTRALELRARMTRGTEKPHRAGGTGIG